MGEHARTPVLVIAVVAAAALAGCAGSPAAPSGGDAPAAEQTSTGPASDPPTVSSVGEQPPPAWVETASGSWWMAYGSYCWDRMCVDMLSPASRDDLPRVSVRQGEEVTFHLGFDPSRLTLSSPGANDTPQVPLPAERDVSWAVTRGGVVNLFARAGSPGGDASYSVRLVLEEPEGSQ